MRRDLENPVQGTAVGVRQVFPALIRDCQALSVDFYSPNVNSQSALIGALRLLSLADVIFPLVEYVWCPFCLPGLTCSVFFSNRWVEGLSWDLRFSLAWHLPFTLPKLSRWLS